LQTDLVPITNEKLIPSESNNLSVVGSVDQGTGRAKLLTKQNYIGRHIHIIVYSELASL